MHCNQNQTKNLALRMIVANGALAVILIVVGLLTATSVFAADFTNRILTIQEKGGSVIEIVAEKEIGSRYTSYLLSKPPRVVFDFQGADISSLSATTNLSEHSVREIHVSSFESVGISSGRVELILTDRVPYNVKVEGTIVHVSFMPAPPAPLSLPTPTVPVVAPVVDAPIPAPASEEMKPEVAPVAVASEKKILSATSILEIVRQKDEVLLRADGELDQCKSFVLKKPARFVVDCFGVTEKIAKKTISLSGPVKTIRIGTYADKIRFVLEGDVKAIVKLKAYPVVDGLALRYDDKSPTPSLAAKRSPTAKASKDKNAALTVENVDFKVVDGHSLVLITLSAPGEIMQPIKDKTLLRFGVKGATIIPSLRRTIDASAFPSVIRQITPYIVNNRAQSDVRFAVELKGDTPYELKSDGNIVTLMVENGPFTKVQGPLDTTIELPLEVAVAAPKQKLAEASPDAQYFPAKSRPEVITNETLNVAAEKKYNGQIVSLNFDNIEIRNVLLLIAEVSDTNIIANDDVKGVITLRLNNVPWDQALDVILESKGLGMEREGSIIRIAPKEVILKRKLDNAKIETEISAIVVKVTKAFSVNYGPVDDIATKIKEQIKENGTVTSDVRTRQIFVTTTPDMLTEIEEQIIKRLDVADQQVTIEARIVEANSNFTRDLGVSWGISQQGTAQGPWDLRGAMITGGGAFSINPGTQATNTTGPTFTQNNPGFGSLFSFGRIGIDSTILDLRLSALESSGYGKIVSTPRITTSNGEAAEISQGKKVPYLSVSANGTETKFVDANLSLKVKPVINPDQSMILEIDVSADTAGTVGSPPPIDTKKAKTKILVKNGETTVIGGIFIESEIEEEKGVPLLRNIPIIGHLFKSTQKIKIKNELMIFITPRIVE